MFLNFFFVDMAQATRDSAGLTVFPGTVQVLSLPIDAPESVIRVMLRPKAKGGGEFEVVGFAAVDGALNVSIAASANSLEGEYRRTLQVRRQPAPGGTPAAEVLTLVLSVVQASAEEIPPQPASPSPDRLEQVAPGVLRVVGELVAYVARAEADPDAAIKDAAREEGCVLLGSVPFFRQYQLQCDEARLAEIQDRLKDRPGVSEVTESGATPAELAFSQSAAPVTPNDLPMDKRWYYDLTKLPEAWGATSSIGSERLVRVAVIDQGFDANHPDMGSNSQPDFLGGSNENQSHGTKVAGIVGAKFNNGTGTAGIARNHVNLALFDFRGDDYTYIYQAYNICRALFGTDIGPEACPQAGTKLPSGAPRVINISMQNFAIGIDHQYLGDCKTSYGNALQSIEEAGADVLFVFAAGNGGTAAKNECPAGLTDDAGLPSGKSYAGLEPRVITVAAIQQPAPGSTSVQLRPDSNYGPTVDVAAPGANVQTLRYDNDVEPAFDGTSAAAPFVAGLAALILAQDEEDLLIAEDVKTCIVESANNSGIPVQGHLSFKLIDADAAIVCTPPLPQPLDVVFAIDTSGSMLGETAEVKNAIQSIAAAIEAEAPDVQYALVTYEDYVGRFDSLPCPSGESDYYGYYGSAGDLPFRLVQPLTADAATIINAVAAVTNGSGADLPQSYGRVFYEVGRAAKAASSPDIGAVDLNFRADATKVLINFGDDLPHDTDINGVETAHEIATPTFMDKVDRDFGFDPGRNNQIDCGEADDIDFQSDALMQLIAGGVRLIHFDSSSKELSTYWGHWTQATGGAFRELNSDGTVVSGEPLDSYILKALRQIQKDVATTP